MKKAAQLFDKIDYAFFFVAKIAVLIMMFITTADAVMRYLFNQALVGAYHFSEKYLMVIIVFFSLSYVMKMKGHISIDLFKKYLPKKLVKVLDMIYMLLAAILMFFIGYQAMIMTQEAYVNHYVATGIISWPTWLSWIWIPVGAYLFTLRLLFIFLQLLFNLNRVETEEDRITE